MFQNKVVSLPRILIEYPQFDCDISIKHISKSAKNIAYVFKKATLAGD